jgi:transposase
MAKLERGWIAGTINAWIAAKALREEATASELAMRLGVHTNQIHDWKKQPIEQAARAFDAEARMEAEAELAREAERPHARIRELTVTHDLSVAQVRHMSASDRQAMVETGRGKLSVRQECATRGDALADPPAVAAGE